jgi:hypothetical protein
MCRCIQQAPAGLPVQVSFGGYESGQIDRPVHGHQEPIQKEKPLDHFTVSQGWISSLLGNAALAMPGKGGARTATARTLREIACCVLGAACVCLPRHWSGRLSPWPVGSRLKRLGGPPAAVCHLGAAGVTGPQKRLHRCRACPW